MTCGGNLEECLKNYQTPSGFEICHASYRKADFGVYVDLSESFAEQYIRSGALGKNRKLLIIKAAVGSTGFAPYHWGVGNSLHRRLTDMIDHALSLNAENRLVALLWHQGEYNAFEQPELDLQTREKLYYSAFKTMAEDLRDRYHIPDLPILAGEMVNDWADRYPDVTAAIETATERVCSDIGHAAIVSSEGLCSNAQAVSWSSDVIHFCADSIEELGRRYFALYRSIVGVNAI